MMIVHGDTMTTLFGAVWARMLRLKVGHVEAGMRSFKLFSPFPEEIDRRVVGKLARVHFAPGKVPYENLKKAKGDVLNIGHNTIYDSILLARTMKPATTLENLPDRYGIVSLHRNELLANKKVFIQTLKTLAEYSRRSPLVFLQHPVTIARAKDLGLESLLSENMIYAPKLDYFSFINLLDGASYAVTDSGGLQEECTYLAKPCLVHRTVTEWKEGLESGIVKLSNFDDAVLRQFLDAPSKLTSDMVVPISSPTGMIVEYLRKHNYI
jgi:UDP-N-acetylglucosamine 2-epimerase (non-hydrolysing)